MKSILIVGVGRFGANLAEKMQELGNDVMIIDKNAELIEHMSTRFDNAQIGDCTNEDVIEALGVSGFDICFVTIGECFEASIVSTSLLKKHGAKCIISKSNHSIQSELLVKIGADEVVFPEKEMAEKIAVRYNAKNVFDYVPLTSDYSIFEIPILPEWVGKSVSDVNVRKKHGINIIAIKKGNTLDSLPGGDYVFMTEDHIVVIGKSGDVFRLSKKT